MNFLFYKATLIKADIIKDQLSTTKYTIYIPSGFHVRRTFRTELGDRVPSLEKLKRKVTLLSTGGVIK